MEGLLYGDHVGKLERANGLLLRGDRLRVGRNAAVFNSFLLSRIEGSRNCRGVVSNPFTDEDDDIDVEEGGRPVAVRSERRSSAGGGVLRMLTSEACANVGICVEDAEVEADSILGGLLDRASWSLSFRTVTSRFASALQFQIFDIKRQKYV